MVAIAQNTSRKNWIDWMKALGMLLIIWGHAFPTGLIAYIYSYNVPLFFIISGFLFKQENSFRQFFNKNLYSLVIPYLLLCVIKDFSYLLKNWNNFQELINCPIGILTGFHTYNGVPAARSLWFVYTLFILKILFQISGNKRSNLMMLLAIALIGSFALNHFSIHPDWAVSNTFAAIPWFMCGYVISKDYKQILENVVDFVKKWRTLAVTVFILLTLLLLFVSNINGEVMMYKGYYGNNIILFLAFGLIGSISIFILSAILDNLQIRAVQVISIGTMVILMFHRDIYRSFEKIVSNLSDGVISEGLLSLSASVVTLILFIPIIIILQKIFPIILGRRTIK